jgi:trans-aconitate 2-methyltransferase
MDGSDNTRMREWNAEAYHRISNPQFAMAIPVLARLPLIGTETVLDIGCGTGRVTEKLAERLPHGQVVAVDVSLNMVAAAHEYLAARYPRRTAFVQADATALPIDQRADAIFSTASFHWVLDHAALFRSLFRALKPGGRIVAQCGGAGNLQRIHDRSIALMESPPFAAYFTHWTMPWEFADANTTRARLEAVGFTDISAWVERAPIILPDVETFTTFMTNVVLRHHIASLPTPALQRAFVQCITESAAGDTPAFELDYRRLNVEARRPGSR